MKTSEVLRAAKGLIEDPARHTTKVWARKSGDAVAYCALGAIAHIATRNEFPYGNDVYCEESRPAVEAFKRVVGGDGFRWNDSHTHAEVMAAFDSAIAAEEAAEGPQTFPSEWVRTEVPA